jgi:hypothetical protein
MGCRCLTGLRECEAKGQWKRPVPVMLAQAGSHGADRAIRRGNPPDAARRMPACARMTMQIYSAAIPIAGT